MNKYICLIILFICGFTGLSSAKKVVYDTLIYTHETHRTKYDVGDCDVCHTNIAKSKRARDDNYADDQSCATEGCHDIKNQDSCFVCHTNADAPSPIKPKREIIHSHKAHAEQGIECKDCHDYIDKKYYYTRKEMVKMEVCIDCHKQEKVSTDCEQCHTSLPIVISHDGETQAGHGYLYEFSSESCNRCHSNSHCSTCHQGLVSQDVHPGNYRYTHKFDVFSSRTNCLSCHTSRNSCDGCHEKSWKSFEFEGNIITHKQIIKENTSCKSCH